MRTRVAVVELAGILGAAVLLCGAVGRVKKYRKILEEQKIYHSLCVGHLSNRAIFLRRNNLFVLTFQANDNYKK